MKKTLAIAFMISGILSATGLAIPNSTPVLTGVSETRCGWFVNPTPANAWLTDAVGEWIISVQGGYQSEGDWPNFSKSQWLETNGHYGYGCACMKVEVNKSEEKITKIFAAYAKPLSACRKDKALKGKEPKE